MGKAQREKLVERFFKWERSIFKYSLITAAVLTLLYALSAVFSMATEQSQSIDIDLFFEFFLIWLLCLIVWGTGANIGVYLLSALKSITSKKGDF